MKGLPEIGEIVVLSDSRDATLFRVTDRGAFNVGLIDATIEYGHPNQSVQWVDVSLVRRPTKGQMQEGVQ